MNTTLALSTLGIIHTVISVLALVFAIIALVRTGKIDPHSNMGINYLVTTVLACVSAFGLSKAGGFNPGHALGIIILVLFAMVYLAVRTRTFGRFSAYVETFCMSASLLFSLIPGINETLQRVPVGNPIASSMDAPVIKNSVTVLFILFIIGVIYQFRQLKGINNKAKTTIN